MRPTLLPVFCFTSLLAMGQSVVLQPVATGLLAPLEIVHAGDARLFIVERAGRIQILLPHGGLAATPFLNITDRVNSLSGEQGLLGLAFDPDYAQNGHFYVSYVGGTGNGVSRLSRFTVTADPNMADPDSEVIFFSLPQPATNHNGGDVKFGPDGYLWFALGDGGGSGDPNNRSQNMAQAHGKMLRIDVSNGAPYTIPPDNPFATANPADTLREIWASGLRNPWRFSFDALTGDVWIADVGQGMYEEINLVLAGDGGGHNFGWRCYEGNAPYNLEGCGPVSDYTFPIHQYGHTQGACSVTGGFVYRGAAYPALQGMYIFSDYCQGRILALQPDGQDGWDPITLMPNGSFGPASFGEDVHGELFVCNIASGVVSRVVDPDAIVRLRAAVFLDGPLDPGTMIMDDGLRSSGAIPLQEPYSSSGHAHTTGGGGETTTNAILSIAGNNAIVDWVRVELRTAANPGKVVAAHHALLKRDGDIVAADGTTGLDFGVGAGAYYVSIRHRNHLGAMSATPITLSATTTAVDFRSAGTGTFGMEAQKSVGSQRALWAGNTSADNKLQYTGQGNDRDPILAAIGGTVPTNTITGYHLEDVNLDGMVRYTGFGNDRDPILSNIGGVVPTLTRVEQLP